MGLGDRIEERRKVVGLSQAELARRIGVRQSTINSLVNGNSRTSRSLLAIARELQTTPAYLTGETDDPSSSIPDEGMVLTTEEREWVDLLRALPVGDRKATMHIVRSLANCARAATS